MKYFLSLIITVKILFAQTEVAIINDSEDFTNLREGKGTNYSITDKLYDGEFFFFYPDTNESWIKVYKMWNIEGYVHKSRILPLKELSADKKKALIVDIFYKEKELAQKIDKSDKIREKFKEHHELRFLLLAPTFLTKAMK